MNETLIKVNNIDKSSENLKDIDMDSGANSNKSSILPIDNNSLDNQKNSLDPNEENNNYDFLDKDKKSVNDADVITTQFDTAFKKASPVIQNYILDKKFEENIRLICKIEKLDDDKAKIIIENIAVSILVGLLPISIAKDTMIESFRSSGIILESFTATMIMKSIDTYILSDIRKQILADKVTSNREIRHLTLKEKKTEEAKEDLRKILLEKTGNLTGAPQPLIQYQHRDLSKIKEKKAEEVIKENKPILNRDTLLSKLGLVDITDTQKALDRMREIKKSEEERINNEGNPKNNLNLNQGNQIAPSTTLLDNNATSDSLANILKNKLVRKEDENANLDNLREERGIKEAQNEEIKNDFNLKAGENNYTENSDPYRETIT